MSIFEAALLKLVDKVKVARDLNHRRKNPDDPLGHQYYCGWESGMLAGVAICYGEELSSEIDKATR